MQRIAKYVADDGTEFATPEKCEEYEKQAEKMKWYDVKVRLTAETTISVFSPNNHFSEDELLAMVDWEDEDFVENAFKCKILSVKASKSSPKNCEVC